MSVAGKWNVTMDTPMGTQKLTWDFQPSGAGWTGTMDGTAGRADLTDIAVDGSNVSFRSRVSTPMGALNLTFQGAANGDRISGVCKTMFGDAKFEGSRA